MTTHPANTQPEMYKWLILALATFTFTFVVAIPQMSLPVLFAEISEDLGLSLVQVGWIWGMGSVLGILVGIIGGSIGDRFGPRRTLAVACLLMGIAGAARGLSSGFASRSIPRRVHGHYHDRHHRSEGHWRTLRRDGHRLEPVCHGHCQRFLTAHRKRVGAVRPWGTLFILGLARGGEPGVLSFRAAHRGVNSDPTLSLWMLHFMALILDYWTLNIGYWILK